MELLVGAVLLGLIPAFIAKRKGRSAILWWFYGTLLFLVALPHALLLRPAAQRRLHDLIVGDKGQKSCPSCGADIHPDATVCRYCQKNILAAPNQSRVVPPSATGKSSPDRLDRSHPQAEWEAAPMPRGSHPESRLVNILLIVAMCLITGMLAILSMTPFSPKETKELPLEPTPQKPSVYAKTELNIRSGPGTTHEVVRRAPEGEQLFYIDKIGEWYQLQMRLGREEWVHQSVVSPTAYKLDIPAFLGEKAFAVQKIIEEQYGKPQVHKPPVSLGEKEVVGTMFWKIDNLRFGFDFYANGDIGANRDGKLVLVGFKEEQHTAEKVLQAGNLREGSPGYHLEVSTSGNVIEVLIFPNR